MLSLPATGRCGPALSGGGIIPIRAAPYLLPGKLAPSASHAGGAFSRRCELAKEFHFDISKWRKPSDSPDFGITTPDFGERRGRYFVPTMPINTQRGSRADDWMERMRSHGALPRAREDLKNAYDH